MLPLGITNYIISDFLMDVMLKNPWYVHMNNDVIDMCKGLGTSEQL